MHLVLDPAHDAAHGDWLRQESGAYEWWYFDALSEDQVWSLSCIWFLGNPFSPYYRLAQQGERPDPWLHNALFFALHRHGRLHAYHFTQFPQENVFADESRPCHLKFGPNTLTCDNGIYQINLCDTNGNGHSLAACLTFSSPLQEQMLSQPIGNPEETDRHYWLPAAPKCRVSGTVTLQNTQNTRPLSLVFSGTGYHDHNWGTLPFAPYLRDWYWARSVLDDGRAVVFYHLRYRRPRPAESHLLLFQDSRLVYQEQALDVRLSRPRFNAFGMCYAARLDVKSSLLAASFELKQRLESAPFYVRALSSSQVTENQIQVEGRGMAEYFRPHLLRTWLAASATKARIVVTH